MNKPIRVLHVFGSLDRGGAETMVMNLYRNIDRKLIQFDFIKHTSDIGAYEDEIKELGGVIYSFPRYKGTNHIKYVNSWYDFFENNNEYRIIHGHVRSTASIYLKIAKKYRLTTISHSHSTSNGKGISAIVKKILQYPIRHVADYFFAASVDSGRWLFGEEQIQKKNFYVIKNAINLSSFSFNDSKRKKMRESLRIKDNFVLGHVGRFTESKNHYFLLDIFNEVRKINPMTKLLLVGSGEFETDIRKKAERLNVTEDIIFTNSQPNVNELMQAMDVFVFPSLFEGLGIVAIEAQASGLPTIVSDKIPSEVFLTNLIKNISLESNAKLWAKEIIKQAGVERIDMSKNVNLKKYDIENNAELLTKIYFEILS